MARLHRGDRLRRWSLLVVTVAAVSLVVPAALAGEKHRVITGDNLSRIAARHDSSVYAIAARNDLTDPDLVVVGDELVVPTGRWVGRWEDRYRAPEVAPEDPGASAPAVAATTETPASGSVTGIIAAAAAAHGVDGGYLVSIARCESGLDPRAVNSAGYYGLFQYDQQTWSAYGSGSIYDPAAQADATARLVAAGQTSRWPNCA